MNRRVFLQAGSVLVAGLLPARVAVAGEHVRVRLVRDPASGFVGFDPVGLRIQPGARVTWENSAGVHTVTAYHPDNGGRALRIPGDAEAWDSGYLMQAGESFSREFVVPGVYDYFCIPHERAGMAGRIVVAPAAVGNPVPDARPCGPGSGDPGVPAAVCERLPSVDRILRAGRVPG